MDTHHDDGLPSSGPPVADDGQPALPGFGNLFSLETLAGVDGQPAEPSQFNEGAQDGSQFEFGGFGFDAYQPAPGLIPSAEPKPGSATTPSDAVPPSDIRRVRRFNNLRIMIQGTEITTRGGRMLVNIMVENGDSVEFDQAWCRAALMQHRGRWVSATGAFTKNSKTGHIEIRLEQVDPAFPQHRKGSVMALSNVLLPVLMQWPMDGYSMPGRQAVWTERIAALIDGEPPGALDRLVADFSPCLDRLADTPQQKAELAQAWFEAVGPIRLNQVLKEAGFKDDESRRIVQRWREKSYSVLKENPYAIVSMGFEVARAESLVAPLNARPVRGLKLVAHLRDALNKIQSATGSTALSLEVLLSELVAAESLTLPDINEIIDVVRASRGDMDVAVVAAERRNFCGIGRNVFAEVRFGQFIARQLNAARRQRSIAPTVFRDQYDQALQLARAALQAMMPGKPVDQVQAEAVALSAIEPISILTGGPGTGKSTVSRALVDVLERLAAARPEAARGKVVLISPTGKAAIRLGEMAGREATTMHRALGITPGGYDPAAFEVQRTFGPNDMVVVDEASMMDSQMADALIRAAPAHPGPGFRIVLIGDDAQLDPVGPGRPFADMLAACNGGASRVPFTRLAKVHRQNDAGGIALGAAKVRMRESPMIRPAEGIATVADGSVGMLAAQPQDVTRLIKREFAAMQKRGEDPANTAVVLSPMRKGPGGVYEINAALSDVLNPHGEPIIEAQKWRGDGPVPRVGDRVITGRRVVQRHHGTDNGTEIVNSATGRIVDRQERGRVTVDFDGIGPVTLDSVHLSALMIGYAITIHKSQGSQYPTVFMPVLMSQAAMLENRLLYTGWTRAMNRLLLVGDLNAVHVSITSDKSKLRRTLLGKILEERLVPDPAAIPLPARDLPNPDDLDLFVQSYFSASEEDRSSRAAAVGIETQAPAVQVEPREQTVESAVPAMFENMNFSEFPSP